MMAPTFLNVNFANKCTLADLSVTGYTAPVYDEKRGRWSGGTKGDFNLQFLTSQGKTEATYLWHDDGTILGWYDDASFTPSTFACSEVITPWLSSAVSHILSYEVMAIVY
jgi:hypothetical protein